MFVEELRFRHFSDIHKTLCENFYHREIRERSIFMGRRGGVKRGGLFCGEMILGGPFFWWNKTRGVFFLVKWNIDIQTRIPYFNRFFIEFSQFVFYILPINTPVTLLVLMEFFNLMNIHLAYKPEMDLYNLVQIVSANKTN